MVTRKRMFGIAIVAGLATLWLYRAELMGSIRWIASLEAVTADMERMGLWGPVLLFMLFVLQVFLAFIPGQALMVACGYLYGFWWGFLLSWLSLVVGGELAFILARRFGRPFAERWVSTPVLARWDRAAQGQGIVFFALSLVLPLIPNDAMCYVAGLGKISRPRFAISNLLGRGMACALTSAAGAFGGQLGWQVWAILLTAFILLGAAWRFSSRPEHDEFAA